MNARTKSILIIAAAVFSGILIGALSVGAIVNHRIDQLRQLRRPAGFAEVVEDVIRPESREQRLQIREVLQRAARRNMDLRESVHRQHLALLDSVHTDLHDVLTPEQADHLSEWVQNQRRPMRHFRDRPFGPGRMGGPRGGPGRMGDPPPDFPPPPVESDSVSVP